VKKIEIGKGIPITSNSFKTLPLSLQGLNFSKTVGLFGVLFNLIIKYGLLIKKILAI
jgi:hypothetical protein